jgi:DNA-binding MarR family transcriptional regulator
MVRDTSIIAYDELKKENKIEAQRQAVLEELSQVEPKSDREVSVILMIAPSTVSARRNELWDDGLVEPIERVRDELTGRLVWTWHRTRN